jgi:hypothetical protein
MKILPMGAELLHARGRTDMTKLIIPFRNYANEPQNVVAGHITEFAGRGLDTPDVEN